MKKLLLFALLSPLAMQSEVKADVLAETLSKIARPWGEPANAAWRAGSTVSFNLKLDVITALLSVGTFAYKFGLEEPLRASNPNANVFFADLLPKILASHEFYKRGTTLAWSSRPHDPFSYLISVAKIFLCFSDKLMSRDQRVALGRRMNVAGI